MKCRHCNQALNESLIDLGFAPPSNAYLDKKKLLTSEIYFPLRVRVCTNCCLVQTEDFAAADEFFSSDYAYFSSTSSSWLRHAELYCKEIENKLSLSNKSLVVELASNDGYLLKNFVEKKIPCIGIEPTLSTATVAEKLGIQTIKNFFGTKMIQNELIGIRADLIIGNNVYAHVPDINDFTLGMKMLLNDHGTITLEFPHLLKLIEFCQFDTIYHEHFSYLSLYTVQKIFKKFGLKIYDVEEISTHGGSLRIYGCHENDGRQISKSVLDLLSREKLVGLQNIDIYREFQKKSELIKDELLNFLLEKKKEGAVVVAYGAAAKGNTLLNFAGIKTDLIKYVCDAGKAKQEKYMPGSHIPIISPAHIMDSNPQFILILPWNISEEVIEQLNFVRSHGVKFVTAVPRLSIY